jgi:hypothetical protein
MKVVVVFTRFVFILLTVHLTENVLAGSRPRDRHLVYSTHQTACQGICKGGDSVDERMNCLNKCVSPDCFYKIYGKLPLEDGELDEIRKSRFLSCATTERRLSKVPWDGNSNVTPQESVLRDSEWSSPP